MGIQVDYEESCAIIPSFFSVFTCAIFLLQVKAISLHKELFSVDNGFLTPTFKTKRPVVQKFFEKTLQELYAEVDKRSK